MKLSNYYLYLLISSRNSLAIGSLVHPKSNWIVSETHIDKVDVTVDETLCTPQNQIADLYIAHQFRKWKDAMETCQKISRSGINLTDINNIEEFSIWHRKGRQNKVVTTVN